MQKESKGLRGERENSKRGKIAGSYVRGRRARVLEERMHDYKRKESESKRGKRARTKKTEKDYSIRGKRARL